MVFFLLVSALIFKATSAQSLGCGFLGSPWNGYESPPFNPGPGYSNNYGISNQQLGWILNDIDILSDNIEVNNNGGWASTGILGNFDSFSQPFGQSLPISGFGGSSCGCVQGNLAQVASIGQSCGGNFGQIANIGQQSLNQGCGVISLQSLNQGCGFISQPNYAPNVGSQNIFNTISSSASYEAYPRGISVTSENQLGGSISVNGAMPFLGETWFEGNVPSNGQAAMSFGAGPGISLNGGGQSVYSGGACSGLGGGIGVLNYGNAGLGGLCSCC